MVASVEVCVALPRFFSKFWQYFHTGWSDSDFLKIQIVTYQTQYPCAQVRVDADTASGYLTSAIQ